MEKQLVNPSALFDATAFGMSQGVVDLPSGLAFFSGQVAWDTSFQVTADTVEGQAEHALTNLRIALAEAGASVNSIVHLRIYLRGECEEHIDAVSPVLQDFLGESRPAMTVIGVSSLASQATLIEIEAVARVNDGS